MPVLEMEPAGYFEYGKELEWPCNNKCNSHKTHYHYRHRVNHSDNPHS